MKYSVRRGFETGNIHRDCAMNLLLDMQDEHALQSVYKLIEMLWRNDNTSLTAQKLKAIKEHANENQ